MSPVKILYVVKTVTGGLAAVAEQIINSLDKSRFEPSILFDSELQSPFRSRMDASGLKIHNLQVVRLSENTFSNVNRKNRNISKKLEVHIGKSASQLYMAGKSLKQFLKRDIRKIRYIKKVLSENNIDILHTHHSLRDAKAELVAARLAGVKTISHRHGYANYTLFDRFFDQLCDSYIYISNDIARYHSLNGETSSKGVVIHNAIDAAPYTLDHEYRTVRTTEFKCCSNEIAIGMIGRVDWWKGQDIFIKALTQVIKRKPNVKAVLIGDVDNNEFRERNIKYLEGIKKIVDQNGLNDRVLWMGHREDIPYLIGGLDIIVHASTTPEPFGLVVLEGMASAKPVIATAAGGVLDIIRNGETGILVPCSNPEAMADAILKIISQPDLAKRIAMAGRACVLEKFTITHQKQVINRLYTSLLNA